MPTNSELRENFINDLRDRAVWSAKQDQIIRRRMSDRKKQKTKPYVGAPNFVEPVISDNVSEKTEQEITMMLNSPVLAHPISFKTKMDADQRSKLSLAFDGYLRHIIEIRPKLEEGLDTKNSRGFCVFKVIRSKSNRLGILLPDIESIDPKDIIVPKDTKDVWDSERLCHVIRLKPRELRDRTKEYGWNAEACKAIIDQIKTDSRQTSSSDERDVFELTEDLVGLATSGSGDNVNTIVIWECYYYDDNDKATVRIFCPDVPEQTLAEYPWRESDESTDRHWPFVQPRFEPRSRYWYDTRGIGELCMDDQISATQVKNAKAVLYDYFASPLYKGGNRNETNISFRPGSKQPDNFAWIPPPQLPQNFDFDVNQTKMDASRRSGAGSQYMYSANVSATRKLQKTATEVQDESARVAMISSASVDRFNSPMGRIYQLLWEDLQRLKPDIPILVDSDMNGMLDKSLYELDVIWIPASSAKTLNPELQLAKSTAIANFALQLMSTGLLVDPLAIWRTVSSYYDPKLTKDWVIDPELAGAQGQVPIYQTLDQITKQGDAVAQALQAIQQELEKVAQMTMANTQKIAEIERTSNEVIQQVVPQVAPAVV